jgi:hypothetical protein
MKESLWFDGASQGADRGPDEGLNRTTLQERVWSSAEIEKAENVPEALTVVMQWISSYVIKPHHQLGRQGVVCPFVPHSLRMKALWLAQVRTTSGSRDVLCSIVSRYLDEYRLLEPRTGHDAELKTLILVFPDIQDRDAHSLIGGVHRMMKPTIVESGLMLGEFYADNISPGLHNPKFYPLRSPLPLLVFRQMVPNDLVFLAKPSDPPGSRVQFVTAYLRSLGERLPAEAVAEAQAVLAAAKAELRALKFNSRSA